MEDYPKTFGELEERFSTEASCLAYLANLRWPEGFRCPKCKHAQAWELSAGLRECARCGHQTSVTAGTLFHRTRKPICLWFRVIWLVTSQKNGASALGLQRSLGIGCYKTAWTWLHKLRRAMVNPHRDRLGGVVYVDEVYVGGPQEGKRGRGAAGKTLVLIAVEQNGGRTGRVRLSRVADASAASLEEALRRFVREGSEVRTDGWRGYLGVERLGYVHAPVRKTAEIGKDLLPPCHRQAGLLKRWLEGTHQGAVSPEHLDYYLDEYTFRFNRRTSSHRGKLFQRLLENAMVIEPSAYKSIVRGVRGPKIRADHNM